MDLVHNKSSSCSPEQPNDVKADSKDVIIIVHKQVMLLTHATRLIEQIKVVRFNANYSEGMSCGS